MMELNSVAFADRSDRGKLKLTGPQRRWFLHQVLTQAFEDIEPGQARPAAMITAHGRMTAYLEAVATEDAILCHFEPELLPSLPGSLARYVFATQVEIADVSAHWGLVLFAGPGSAEIARRAAPGGIPHETLSIGEPALYMWVARDTVGAVLEAARREGAKPISEDDLEAVRISHGVPRWGRDMDVKTFPQEAGIDDSAVHFDKGCYLGQEAMAKIHFRGKVNRRLRRLVSEHPLRAGAVVWLDGAKVGTVTSASDGMALGMLRHTVGSGAEVVAGEHPARVV